MIHLKKPLKGLYAITPTLPGLNNYPQNLFDNKRIQLGQQDLEWLRLIRQAVSGGARILQFRDKSSDINYRYAVAQQLLDICRAHDIPLIINDDVALAKELPADGVHLGRHDMSVKKARLELGENAIIGVSCYNCLDLAIAAESAGADYIAFGRFFPSQTKPDAVVAALILLTQAKKILQIPVVAIGGINSENALSVIQSGADAVPVVEGVFSQADVFQAAAKLQEMLS